MPTTSQLSAWTLWLDDLLLPGEDPSKPGFDWSPVVERSQELGPDSAGKGWLEVRVAPRDHYFSRSLVIRRPVHLHGTGRTSRLCFAPKQHGIYCTGPYDPGGGASWSILERLTIMSDGYSVHTPQDEAHGLFLLCPVVARDLYIHYFVDGVHAEAVIATDDPKLKGNASVCRFEGVWSVLNRRHGFYFAGGDASQSSLVGCSATDNDGWGFYDASFFGNPTFAPHTNNNKLGGYCVTDPNAKMVAVAPYSEQNEAHNSFARASMVLGGQLTNADAGANQGQVSMSGAELTVPTVRSLKDGIIARLGGQLQAVLEFGSQAMTLVFRLQKDPPLPKAPRGWWGVNFAGLNGSTSLAFCDHTSEEFDYGSSRSSKAWLPFGFFLGYVDDRIFWTAGSGPPSVPGKYTAGSVVWNSHAGPGLPAYWQCVRASSAQEPAGAWAEGPCLPDKALTVPLKGP